MQTLIAVVFVFKYVKQDAKKFTEKAVKYLNSRLKKAKCAKIDKSLVDVSLNVEKFFFTIN